MFHKNKSKRFYETYVFYFLISNFCNKLFKSSQVGTVECNLLYIITSLCIYINQLFSDRSPQSTHLPLAWTKSSKNDRKIFMEKLQKLAESVKPV